MDRVHRWASVEWCDVASTARIPSRPHGVGDANDGQPTARHVTMTRAPLLSERLLNSG